jgi:hypothetical protein
MVEATQHLTRPATSGFWARWYKVESDLSIGVISVLGFYLKTLKVNPNHQITQDLSYCGR